jgi:uncharacterized protein (DUF2236 family)
MTVLDERSVTWRYAGDARLLLFLGRAFLLQAAHPTIAAGVAEHSNFKEDPFGRFQRSWGLVLGVLYAQDGGLRGAQVRRAHRTIKGVATDGRRYHAFEPEAYFWVLASGHETIVETAQRFGRPMSAAERRRAYGELRELGRRFGLRDRDMPETEREFWQWYAWMLENRIERNETVCDVLAVLRRPNPPHGFPALAWPLPRVLVARLSWLTTVGTLPASVRARLGIGWSALDEAQLAALARAFRTLGAIPARWCYLPVAREAFKRPGSLQASATASSSETAAAA